MCMVTANPKAFNAALKAARSVARWAALNRLRTGLWDRDEIHLEAKFQYIRAVARWDGRGTLPGWVSYYVYRKLISKVRAEFGRGRTPRPRSWSFDPDVLDARHPGRSSRPPLTARVAELSEDAQAVASLVFGFVSRDGTGKRVRASVTKRLRLRRWRSARIERAFHELSEVV